jgi:FMN phosphatase YigB (HAD superfamily)
LKNHKNYKQLYKDLEYKDLAKVLPVQPKYGALELKTHPTLGDQMDYDFCHSPEFFNNRPLSPDVIATLQELNRRGVMQITASATFDVVAKTKLLKELFKDAPFLNIECVQHGTFMSDTAKEDLLRYCCEKYNINPKESILVDDRIYNLPAAINLGMIAIRMRSEFTTDTPSEFLNIKEIKTVSEILEIVK